MFQRVSEAFGSVPQVFKEFHERSCGFDRVSGAFQEASGMFQEVSADFRKSQKRFSGLQGVSGSLRGISGGLMRPQGRSRSVLKGISGTFRKALECSSG